MVKGTVAELAVPAVVKDVFGAELILETEDAKGVGFRGIKVILRAFEGSELFNRKVFREVFDSEVGKIVGHSMWFGALIMCFLTLSFLLLTDLFL